MTVGPFFRNKLVFFLIICHCLNWNMTYQTYSLFVPTQIWVLELVLVCKKWYGIPIAALHTNPNDSNWQIAKWRSFWLWRCQSKWQAGSLSRMPLARAGVPNVEIRCRSGTNEPTKSNAIVKKKKKKKAWKHERKVPFITQRDFPVWAGDEGHKAQSVPNISEVVLGHNKKKRYGAYERRTKVNHLLSSNSALDGFALQNYFTVHPSGSAHSKMFALIINCFLWATFKPKAHLNRVGEKVFWK